MKKVLLFTFVIATLFSCNPEGTEFEQPGSVVGTYKLSYIRTSTRLVGASSSTSQIFMDDCVKNSTLTINSSNEFTITNFMLDSGNNCQELAMDRGVLSGILSNYGNPVGDMEFENSVKNTEFFARSTNETVYSFAFNFTLNAPSAGVDRVWYEYFFVKQ